MCEVCRKVQAEFYMASVQLRPNFDGQRIDDWTQQILDTDRNTEEYQIALDKYKKALEDCRKRKSNNG